MTGRSAARRGALALALGMVPLALGVTGCTSGVTWDDTQSARLAHCGKSVKGSRYEVCGHWSTGGFAQAQSAGVAAIGSVDSAPQPKGAGYQVQGGTFHGAR